MRPSLLAAGLLALALAGCSGSGGMPFIGDDSPDTPVPTSTTSTFTGLPTAIGNRVLAVKIDNASAARPQTGLDKADLVYVERVEGGLSRFLAVFSSHVPARIGPVRSARESDLELLQQFGQPALAFSGANGGVLALVKQSAVYDVSQAAVPKAYLRGTDHVAPHNLYARGPELLKAAPEAGQAADIGFRFGAAPAGGETRRSYAVRYPAARFGFTWSADRKRWLVSMDGRESEAGGQRLAASTVVVQYTTIRSSRFRDVLGNPSPYTVTVGSGKAVVLRDGKLFTGSWTRSSGAGGTTFTGTDGSSLTFAAGQVWVLYLPA